MNNAFKWVLWGLTAAILVAVVHISSLLTLAYRENSHLEYLSLIMIAGIAANLFFRDTKLLIFTAVSLPILSAYILPEFFPTLMAILVAVVWIMISFGLGAIRSKI
ncbi:hypothetical protein [Halocynthiibacter styelae]|uniref:Uncharacterized protein n=1 Tax=Halocynthiibacter styelae TaxID=2761955 RepID=A0A8J7ITI7_9RHOB|nr:hypothetical protein [Paenihalocynthiibacter styelae]MBI1492018.1 hypothetical protein [Paenihalocynthiibacter styelae]